MKISIILHHALLMLVINSVTASPTVCISTPTLMAEAGSVVKATIDGSLSGRRCEATLKFSEPDFPHVHFGFEYLTCLGGLQLAEFTIPSEAPNGDAFLLWHCTGQDSPICNNIWITEGENDLDSIVLDQSGTIACIVPTATKTTLATITGTSTTVIEAVASTYFEEIVPTTTVEELFTLSDTSTTMTESLFSTYYSTLSQSTASTSGSTTVSTRSATGSGSTTGSTAASTTRSTTGSASTSGSKSASSTASTTPSTSTASTLTPSLSLTIIAIGTSLSTSLSPTSSPSTSTTATSSSSTMTSGGDGTCVTSTAASCAN